jgi:plasmid stability protein
MDGMATINVELPDQLHCQLMRAARRHLTTETDYIRAVVRQALDTDARPQAQPSVAAAGGVRPENVTAFDTSVVLKARHRADEMLAEAEGYGRS